jgi:hypothetical protein
LQHLYENPANPPRRLVLIKSRADIPPPRTSGYVGLEHAEDELAWRDSLLYTYNVEETKAP